MFCVIHESLTCEHNSCVFINTCVHNLLQLLENISAHNTCYMLLPKKTWILKTNVHTNIHICIQDIKSWLQGKFTHLLHVHSIQVMQCSVATWSCNLVGLRVQWRVRLEMRCCCCSRSSCLRYVCSIASLLFIVTTGWSHGVHDAVCVSTLRVRCECFLRVVVRV